MSQKAIISILSQDRVGLISDVTGYLFDTGVNLGDTSFAILGTGGEFSSLVELPDTLSMKELKDGLADISSLKNADIDIKPFKLDDESDTPPSDITHRIKCQGEDQPGVLARFAEVMLIHDANIVRLKSDRQEDGKQIVFITRMSVYIPENRASSCLATLSNTAQGLGQTFEAVAVG